MSQKLAKYSTKILDPTISLMMILK